uniref:Uncharacterized protein n=1 Tax=Glossina brevipalpis TaxID=37001 RepID=A0A1A9WAJ8_9MUSC
MIKTIFQKYKVDPLSNSLWNIYCVSPDLDLFLLSEQLVVNKFITMTLNQTVFNGRMLSCLLVNGVG